MGGKFEHVEDRRPLVGDSEKDSQRVQRKPAVRLGKTGTTQNDSSAPVTLDSRAARIHSFDWDRVSVMLQVSVSPKEAQ